MMSGFVVQLYKPRGATSPSNHSNAPKSITSKWDCETTTPRWFASAIVGSSGFGVVPGMIMLALARRRVSYIVSHVLKSKTDLKVGSPYRKAHVSINVDTYTHGAEDAAAKSCTTLSQRYVWAPWQHDGAAASYPHAGRK